MGAVAAAFVDFAIAFVVLLGMMLYYGIVPGFNLVWLPLFLLLTLVCSLGIGLWLSALNLKYRDVRYVVPFLTQLWLFVTPIAYPSSMLPARWQLVYGLNPMSGVIEGFRWALLGTEAPDWTLMAVSAAIHFQDIEPVVVAGQNVDAVQRDVPEDIEDATGEHQLDRVAVVGPLL